MPLFGTLSTMPLTDLLQWLAAGRLSGTLQIERNRVSKSIVLQDGQIIGCSSDDPPERLGQFLIARGKITENQLRQALVLQETSRVHLGRILVEMGVLSPDELGSHLEAKAEETIFSLFDWDDAVFRFQQGMRDEASVFPVSLRVEDVLLRGLTRFDELQRIRQVLYDPRLVLRQSSKQPPEAVLANPMARTLYEAIDGDRTLAEILLHVHGSEYVVTKFLFELYDRGFVEIHGIKKIEPVEPPAAGARDADFGDLEPADRREPGAAPKERTPRAPAPELQRPAEVRGAAHPVAAASGVSSTMATPRVAGQPLPTGTPAVSGAHAQAHRFGDVEVPAELEPIEKSVAHRLAQLLERARLHMRQGEFEPALEILDGLRGEFPGDESLRRLNAEAEAAFVEKAYRHFLPPAKIPVLARRIEQLSTQTLTPTEFFLLSRIDGIWDVKSIVQVAPLREADTLRSLKRMREGGLIVLKDPPES